MIIFVHELGHYTCAKVFHWKVDKIYFYPYGGYCKFNEEINRPLKEELFILLAGPITQLLFGFIFSLLPIREQSMNLFWTYHWAILCFNILPIYPLDGGKLIAILLSYCESYKKSLKHTFIFSYCLLGLMFIVSSFFVPLSLNVWMILLLIFVKLTEEVRKKDYYYQKFLLERYLREYPFSKRKIIGKTEDMMRDKKHLIQGKERYYTEKEILKKKFKQTY